MKEVQGELNTTMIVLISVGILMAFFFSFMWPALNHNFESNSRCDDAVCDCKDGLTKEGDIYYCTCHVPKKTQEFKCVYKG
ncbi:MAG: hypothetical protein K2M17_04030 [Bacilli bacterium]|nr:hypothetical protein [Bacilli bacterium]